MRAPEPHGPGDREVFVKVGRNDACPCGSGKKFKQCHLGKERELAGEMGEDLGLPAPPDRRIPMVLVGIGVAAGIAAGVAKGIGAGFVVLVASLLFVGGYLILRDPPKGDPNRPDGSSINFGG